VAPRRRLHVEQRRRSVVMIRVLAGVGRNISSVAGRWGEVTARLN
jgi:hypothetical protein